MTNDLQIFSYESQQVRTVVKNGDPWFVAKDVCEILELGNPRSSIALLDEDEKGVHTMDTLGGNQEFSVISEAGLYSLIMRSRKPEAKAFKRWVTHEVLPSIRRTGGYVYANGTESTEELMARAVLAADNAMKRLKRENHLLGIRVEQMKPKEVFADALAASESSILVRDMAKLLYQNGVDTGEQRFFKWLRENGYLIRGGRDKNHPTQRAMKLGIFEVSATTVSHGDGKVKVHFTPLVTCKGQSYFLNKFLSSGLSTPGAEQLAWTPSLLVSGGYNDD